MTIFETLSTIMNTIIDKVTPTLITPFMNELRPVAVAGVSIYFIWIMFPLIIGKGEGKAEDAIKKLIVWSIVWSFAFNTGGWLTQANQAINAMYNWAAGTTSIYTALDASYVKVVEISKTLYGKDHADYVKIEGFLAMSMVLGSYYLFAFISVALLVVSKMILHLLVLALPITILAILFPIVKTMFSRWLELFIDNILTVLFLNIMFDIINDELSAFITKAKGLADQPNLGNLVSLGFDVSLTIMLMLLFVFMARIMASKLASAAMSSESMSSIPRPGLSKLKDMVT